jgi:hypothetical protein
LQVLARGLAVEKTNELKQNFAREVVKLRSAPKIPGFTALLARAALEGWSRPEEFFTLFMALLEQDPFIAACIARTARSPGLATTIGPLSPSDLARLADNKLLYCMMVSAPIRDEALERLLTSARRTLLDLAGSREAKDASDAISGFCCALARQCFIN